MQDNSHRGGQPPHKLRNTMDEIRFKELNEKAIALRKEILDLEYQIRRLAILDTSRLEEQVKEKRALLDTYSRESFEMVKRYFNRR